MPHVPAWRVRPLAPTGAVNRYHTSAFCSWQQQLSYGLLATAYLSVPEKVPPAETSVADVQSSLPGPAGSELRALMKPQP